jgi:hypothetical protein
LIRPFGADVAALVAGFFMRGRMAGMDTRQHNALVATLNRIDDQIAESDTLLLNSLTGRERLLIRDELAYLRIERLKVVAKLQEQ